jgi:tocopherol O-methyltransferase
LIHSATPPNPADVAGHYDELDPFYRELWGEHVHHGLWLSGGETQAEAVAALSDRVADGLAPSPGQKLVDIGCGYGGTARRLATRRGVSVTGLTLSRAQASQATADPKVRIIVADWLENGFAAAEFDGAYAIESSEHMADKPRFFAEAYRVLKPGGRLVVCAWLAAENASAAAAAWLLEPICREGRMPSLGSASEYANFAAAAGFRLVSFDDLSRQVRRTWTICTRRLFGKLVTDPAYIARLADPRMRHRVFALSLPRLVAAYWLGALEYGIGVWEKPMD